MASVHRWVGENQVETQIAMLQSPPAIRHEEALGVWQVFPARFYRNGVCIEEGHLYS
eukprot:CAMPEP_0171076574 /NCGR_PEP_ID=MMETSP0766_2-20121228/13504_1 /TAXON_ID=439317 /ORGANISM="Gambierdiscus australes, Strain CAWD 149" /LENGTH=56 /DNA_ID=CAMNT_0011533561 /DNA_START=316 /DNA_END=483 /DNA_ORIENTATION=-